MTPVCVRAYCQGEIFSNQNPALSAFCLKFTANSRASQPQQVVRPAYSARRRFNNSSQEGERKTRSYQRTNNGAVTRIGLEAIPRAQERMAKAVHREGRVDSALRMTQ